MYGNFLYLEEKGNVFERLYKYGHIKRFKRRDDNKNYNAYYQNGLIKVECTDKNFENRTMTIDTFLYLFLENEPSWDA